MRKVFLALIAALVVSFCTRVTAQVTAADRTSLDSSIIKQRAYKNIDSLTTLIKRAKDKQLLANLYLKRGISEGIVSQPDSAIKDYSAVIALNPNFIDAYSFRGAQYEQKKNYEAAIADDEKVAAVFKNNPVRAAALYTSIGKMAMQLKNYEKVLKAQSALLELNPNNGFAYFLSATCYVRLGQYGKAIENYDAAVPLYKNAPPKLMSELLGGRADAKRRLRKFKDAINDFSLALNIDPDNRYAHWNRAACYYNNHDYELADAGYTKAISYFSGDDANLAILYYDRANVEMGEQKYTEAIRDDSLAITHNDKYGAAYWGLATAHAQHGDFQQGIDWYKQTLKYYADSKPALSAIHDNIANWAYFMGHYDDVVYNTTTAIELDARAWSPHLNRGRALLKQGKNDQAADDFKQVLALDTTKKSFEYAFALFYTGNADQGVQVMQGNVVSTGDPALLISHYYNLACLYSLLKRPDEANTYLKKCIDGGYSKRYAQLDPDLENIRNTPDFKAMMTTK